MGSPGTGGRGPAHTLDLLWGTVRPGRRGPRGGLSVEAVVRAAMDLADTEGLAAVSMRRVAESLDVTTMSLYRYVPGKDDLCDLMLDAASGTPETADWPDDWRGALEHLARDMRALFRRRPWVLEIPLSGPPLGPNNLAWMEAGLAAMRDTALDTGERIRLLMLLTGHVRSEGQRDLSMERAGARTGVAPREWGRVYGEMLGRVLADERFPTLARHVREGMFDSPPNADPEEDFEAGLALLLDGVEAILARRAAAGDDPAG
ncbi:TetR/AcrR family transcriptional regulator [Streptomyces alkaliphilus]|uniref:TetR/AcrR family transcriptional regulator n=1 Tax=Streptomyces alkaliphilus TaxID=1472722 RepID=UPI00117D8175|nr:TetR/AcrR family transcriptional regulator [Streptomyces alkaliphilus]MQS09091.1 TetR family transcriptional regulator [Streptomyces alkaliphilus]